MVAGVAHEVNNPLAFVRNNLVDACNATWATPRPDPLYQEADGIARSIAARAAGADPSPGRADGPGLHADEHRGPRRTDHRGPEADRADRQGSARLRPAGRGRTCRRSTSTTASRPAVGDRAVAARQKQVEIETDLEPLPPRSICYPAKLNQVVLNLLTNAIDASPQGGTVTIRTRSAPDGGVTLRGDRRRARGSIPRSGTGSSSRSSRPSRSARGRAWGCRSPTGSCNRTGAGSSSNPSPTRGTRFTVHLPLVSPGPTSERPDGSGGITIS